MRVPSISQLIILWSIKDGVYGYSIMQRVNELAEKHGVDLQIGPGTLYPLIKRLKDANLIYSVTEPTPIGGANREMLYLTKDGAELVKALDCFISELKGVTP